MHVIPLPAHNPGPYTGEGNWTYLILAGEATLIDAGVGRPEHIDSLASALEDARAIGLSGRLDRVLVTHAHSDHMSGVTALAERWPDAVFLKYPWPEADARFPGPRWVPLADDQLVAAGNVALWTLHTPGHAPDHVALLEPRSATLFGGDLVIAGASVMIPAASQGGSMFDYLRSLERIAELAPRRILPAHGAPIDNPQVVLRNYIRHRLQRERQVCDHLTRSPSSTAEALADQVYPGVSDALRRAAIDSVQSHLEKLAHEGRARHADGRWTLLTVDESGAHS